MLSFEEWLLQEGKCGNMDKDGPKDKKEDKKEDKEDKKSNGEDCECDCEGDSCEDGDCTGCKECDCDCEKDSKDKDDKDDKDHDHDGLTEKQKKLPKGLRDAILKKKKAKKGK